MALKGQEEILEARDVRLTVMTANVCGPEQYGFSHRKAASFEVFKQEYAKGKPDIVGFQELAPGNWEEVFGKVRPDLDLVPGEQLGNFVIVNPFAYMRDRFKVIEHGTIWLSPDRTKVVKAWDSTQIERAMTWGILEDLQNNRPFLVQNIHPDNVGPEARRESIGILIEEANKIKLPTIVTADSNVSVHSPTRARWSERKLAEPYHMMLDAGFKDTWREAHPGEVRPTTFHAHRGPRYSAMKHDGFGTADTDWIMTRGPFRTDQSWIVYDHFKSVYPSDHFWVETVLVWE